MSVLTVWLREEILAVVALLHVLAAKDGRKASVFAIGMFLAYGHLDAELDYFQGEPVITINRLQYRLTEDGWQRDDGKSVSMVTGKAEALSLDLFLQQATYQYIVLAYTEDDMEAIAAAYILAKQSHLSR